MLLSQRVAKNKNFLQEEIYKGTKYSLSWYREKIIKAVKIVVGQEFFDSNETLNDSASKIYNLPIEKIHPFAPVSTLSDKAMEKLRLMQSNARLPFPLMFIETNDYGILLRSTSKTSFEGYVIDHRSNYGTDNCAYVRTSWFIYNLEEAKVKGLEFFNSLSPEQKELSPKGPEQVTGVWVQFHPQYIHALNNLNFTQDQVAKKLDSEGKTYQTYGLEVLNVLLFMNVRNVVLHHYKPKKHELIHVPKEQQKYYEYRILDIFREKHQYVKLSDVEDFTKQSHAEKQQRRAHLVTGHFKTFHRGTPEEKTFWWSAHMRNTKNLVSHGLVDKDYRLQSA